MSGEFNIELVCCESVIKNELQQGLTQKQVAQTYAMAIVSTWKTNWKEVNAAIVNRWSAKGLERVKKMAWKIIEAKRKADLP